MQEVYKVCEPSQTVVWILLYNIVLTLSQRNCIVIYYASMLLPVTLWTGCKIVCKVAYSTDSLKHHLQPFIFTHKNCLWTGAAGSQISMNCIQKFVNWWKLSYAKYRTLFNWLHLCLNIDDLLQYTYQRLAQALL